MARRKKPKSTLETLGRYARRTAFGAASALAELLEITPPKKAKGKAEPTARAGATYRLAVYGTCRKGGSNHWRIRGARFLGQVTIQGHIRVQRAGGPAIVPGAGIVRAELYAVSGEQLRDLDAFEGWDFPRRPVRLEDGSTAWAYVYRGEIPT
jgi:gamma-glutamylcyclotransferase (GGCT)/AIG2-like uncharacterized protein YtfP